MAMRIWKWGLGVVMVCGMLLGGVMAAKAEVSVTDVSAVPRYPWNGLVDIRCTVSDVDEGEGWGEFVVEAVDGETGSAREVSHFQVVREGIGDDDAGVYANGEYELLWDARADLGEVVVGKMIVRVTVRARGQGGVQLWAGGPYWADRNLGAKNPWDYGRYFWWGDTKGSLPGGFSFDLEITATMKCKTIGKTPDQLRSEGWITAAGVLAPNHDAAHVQWGGGWRMPTDQELRNLCNKCDWAWTMMNGVKGLVVCGRGDFAEASIFIPAAGYGYGTSLDFSGVHAFLWSSVPSSRIIDPRLYHSWSLYSKGMDERSRVTGIPVRPVRESAP